MKYRREISSEFLIIFFLQFLIIDENTPKSIADVELNYIQFLFFIYEPPTAQMGHWTRRWMDFKLDEMEKAYRGRLMGYFAE